MESFLGVPIHRGEAVRQRVGIAEFADSSDVTVPVVTVGGVRAGPTLYVQAGVHGEEMTGVEVCRRALATLDPATMSGNVVAVPVANVPSHLSRTRGFLHEERWMLDIYRNFPGDAGGLLTQRLANVLFEAFVRAADFTIDMHSALDGADIAPFVYVVPADDTHGTLKDREKYAWAFGSPYVYYQQRGRKFGTTVVTTSLPIAADAVGAPMMLAEMGESRRVSWNFVETGVRGIRNVMRAMGILSGEPEVDGPQSRFNAISVVHCTHGGALKLRAELGDDVRSGDPVAELYDVFGDRIEVVESPVEGFVLRLMRLGSVASGAEVTWIGHT